MESRKHRLDLLEEGEDTEARTREPELLTVGEAAAYLRVDSKWVYAHARELGGYRLLGDRGPWRFRRRDLLARREAERRSPVRALRSRQPSGARRPTRTPSGAPILPAEPRREAS